MSKIFLKCIDNTDVETLLTLGKTYTGEIIPISGWWWIEMCDDNEVGHFQNFRFEEVIE